MPCIILSTLHVVSQSSYQSSKVGTIIDVVLLLMETDTHGVRQ